MCAYHVPDPLGSPFYDDTGEPDPQASTLEQIDPLGQE